MSARSVAFALAACALLAHGGEPGSSLPDWPEELGRLTAPDRERALTALRELAADGSQPQRVAEARYRRALLDLAPLASRDVARARGELALLARGAGNDRWAAASRYALGWIEEQEGDAQRARDAYRAIVLEDPRSVAALRSGTAIGRLELRGGEPAEAAVWLQAVLDRGGAPGATDLREAALREVLQAAQGVGRSRRVASRSSASELREATALVRTAAGDVIAADRKRGVVVRFAQGETVLRTWPLAAVTALAVDPYGRAFAAASGAILRLDEDAPAVVARSGAFGAVSALAVDAAGRIWIADRRGDRVGIASPDGDEPALVGGKRAERVTALAWDGRRVVALEAGPGRVVALRRDGGEEVVVAGLAETQVGLTANEAGTVALLDERGEIVVVSAVGKILERFDPKTAGVARPLAIALGSDGSIDCFDAADGRVARLR